jgi:rubrerythrin
LQNAERLIHTTKPPKHIGEQTNLTNNTELLAFIKAQIKIENEIVNSLNKGTADMQNPAVKAVLKGISLDSVKHAEMYTSATTLLTTTPKALQQQDLDKQRKLVEKHIQLEAELIQKITQKLPTIQNKKVKLLLNAILEDEKRHHELLKQILETLIKGETITENDWWDVLWKNVPFHGSPGG